MRFVFRPFWKILSLSSLCFWALPPSPATNSAFSHSLTQFSTYVHDTKWTWVLTLKKLHYPRNPVFMQFHRKVYMQSFQHTLNITNNTRNTVCKVNDYLDNLMTQIFSKKYFPFTLAPTNTYSKNWEKISLVFHRKIIWWIVWWLYIWWLWNIARNIEKEAPIILLIVCHFSCIVARIYCCHLPSQLLGRQGRSWREGFLLNNIISSRPLVLYATQFVTWGGKWTTKN